VHLWGQEGASWNQEARVARQVLSYEQERRTLATNGSRNRQRPCPQRSRPKRRKPEGAVFGGKKVRFGIKKVRFMVKKVLLSGSRSASTNMKTAVKFPSLYESFMNKEAREGF
jgi:hypothetical protein